jgi:glycosyltransferase involved in cell wall biosynthesis
VDVDRVAAAAAAGPAIAPRGRPALISAGRLMPQKGFDLLLDALAQVRVEHPDVHLTILGEGPDRAALEAQARALGIAEHVTFAGFCDEPLPQIRAADLFVLASRYEGFPNAALEALACGTPIVLTDCPGASAEMVVPGVNGQLARSIDAASVASAITAALAERTRYDRAAIRDDCARRYGAAKIVSAYERVFTSLAEGAR